MYTIAFIDRTNISLALSRIGRDLHLDPQQAGTVAGIFFWGYLALQIPGGHLAKHWSAKRSEEHTSELQSLAYLVCRLLLEKKKQFLSNKRYNPSMLHCRPPREPDLRAVHASALCL